LLSVLVFLLTDLMPGDELTLIIEQDPNMTTEQIMRLREMAGLNDPWYERYFRWLGNVLQGDLGMSYHHQQPVTSLLGERVGKTVLLSFCVLIVTYLISIPLGIISGRWT